MKTIRERVGTPSHALELMLEGLLDEGRPFEINMETFGKKEGETCFGCAATCAVWKLLPKSRFNISVITRRNTNGNAELSEFENAIDSVRMGYMRQLFNFFGMEDKLSHKYSGRIHLETYDWRKQVPEIQKLIEDLKAEGL